MTRDEFNAVLQAAANMCPPVLSSAVKNSEGPAEAALALLICAKHVVDSAQGQRSDAGEFPPWSWFLAVAERSHIEIVITGEEAKPS